MGCKVHHTLSVHDERKILLKLKAAGLDETLVQKVIDSEDNELASKVVHLMMNGGFEPSDSQRWAREIMGRNFFGIEEAIRHFGVDPQRRRHEIDALYDVPFTEETLESVKDTHILVAILPISILDIRSVVEDVISIKVCFGDKKQPWYNNDTFARDPRGFSGWCLVRKTRVEKSNLENWNGQLALLDKGEEVPSARIMIYTIFGYYLATGERLFEDSYVRTASINGLGGRVYVGGFNERGIYLDGCSDEKRYSGEMGVCSCRKKNLEIE